MLTIVDILRQRATQQADQTAYIFLKDGELEESPITYAQLDAQARAIATQLIAARLTGERALLLYPPGLEFIAAFYGCLYAGVIAVPIYPPRPNRSLERIRAIVNDCQAAIALTTGEILGQSQRKIDELPELRQLSWLATDQIAPTKAMDWTPPTISLDTLAFLQYTSGSTGKPKGVMVSHGNIMHNCEYNRRVFVLSPDSVGVLWLPSFHDMGLIDGVMLRIYVGFVGVFMAPVAFLQQPLRWLQAISRYKGTHGGGPNFGYDLCVQKITPEQREQLDLSSWQTAYNGAEPIRKETLEKFTATFAASRFQAKQFFPCYGLAETTLCVSGGTVDMDPIYLSVQSDALEQHRVVAAAPDSQQNVRQLVSSGRVWFDMQVVIADPEQLTRCAPDHVGEIWVSSGSVTKGYWQRPEETANTYQAYLADTGAGPFFRTGDLGFFHNGELFITGRIKDVIIIRGRNHYPHDIELTVERSHPALRPGCGAAFSVDVQNEERLVVVQELERTAIRKLDVETVVNTIRQAVADEYELQVYAVTLLKTGGIFKTSSGKIQRRACRAAFLDGSLDVVAEWRQPIEESAALAPAEHVAAETRDEKTAEQIRLWLRSKIAQQARMQPEQLDMQTPFAHYGLDSRQMISLTGELEIWLGRRVAPTLAYDYPTISALAEHLAGIADSPQMSATPTIAPSAAEPIAIIGLGCRFPEAENPEAFWQLLEQHGDAIGEVPPSRWDVNAYYDPQPGTPEKMNTRWGGFLREIDGFDPQFFGIAPREAASMDPQQRLLLEVCWEALEYAGIAPTQLAHTQTGVFIGVSNYDYAHLQFHRLSGANAYAGTGNALSIAANRISYLLDLRGPSLAIDTACSSSLVAIHQACQSLRSGESDVALAGGVNLILNPDVTVAFSQLRLMSPDGRCKAFDARADGYVRSEGCGMVVLKRLSDAAQAGDNILAVIAGSAVNQDGRSNGLTAPNGQAQQAVIRQALRNANVAPQQISYLEAHGTGTALGDPIEMQSIQSVLTAGRSPENPLWVGTVKTNIGHLESAAGIAGLIKTVLSLQHRTIPANVHFRQLNPQITLEASCKIPTVAQAWNVRDGQRMAGVSSFGFGGTNAHIIVAEAPERPHVPLQTERPAYVLTLSAQNAAALQAAARQYAEFLRTHTEINLADMCHTANIGRAHFAHRLACLTASIPELQGQLQTFADGASVPRGFVGQAKSDQLAPVAFLFTGQGSQYVGMGRQLYDTQPTFRSILNQCDEILRACSDISLLDVFYPELRQSSNANPNAHIDQTAYTQPALFALEYALAQVWREWGVQPAFVMGHSVGEYAAACCAGVFSLEDGLKLIAARARLMQALPQNGAMAVIFAPLERMAETLQPYTQTVSVAAINSPNHIVISGEQEAVNAICERLRGQGITSKRLNVSHAFHSPLMEPMLAEFARVAETIAYALPQIPIISNLTGQIATADIATPAYWIEHIRRPVQFMTGMQTLHQQGRHVFLEIGPHPTLIGMGQQCFSDTQSVWLASLRQGEADWQQMSSALSACYVQGLPVNWAAFDGNAPRQRLALPTYPFQRQRCWVDGMASGDRRTVATPAHRQMSEQHLLLGKRIALPGTPEMRFETQISQQSPEFLAQHRVWDTAIFPATAYLEIFAAAGEQVLKTKQLTIADVMLPQALLVPEQEPATLQCVSTPDGSQSATLKLFSSASGADDQEAEWTLHATAHISPAKRDAQPEQIDLAALKAKVQTEIPVSAHYQRCQDVGIAYGTAFQGIAQLWRDGDEALAHVRLPENLSRTAAKYLLHPALLDACLQTIEALLPVTDDAVPYLPIKIDHLHLHRPLESDVWAYARLLPSDDPHAIAAAVQVIDSQGKTYVVVAGLHLKPVRRETVLTATPENLQDWLYAIDWRTQARQMSAVPPAYLPTPATIYQTLQPHIAQMFTQPEMAAYGQVLDELNHLSVAYIAAAFQQMGWTFPPQARFTADALCHHMGIIARHQRLTGRLLDILAEEGVLRQHKGQWETLRELPQSDPNMHADRLLARYPSAKAELTLLKRCGAALAQVLTGRQDPLQLLFPEGEIHTATALYQDSPGAKALNALAQKTLTTLLERLPIGRALRILEIGGGTGGTTMHLLPHLPGEQTEYVFTDISPLFLNQARTKFHAYPFVRCERLDIEQSPDAQGFSAHYYDVVIAANVLHATQDLRQTLAHVRQLLAPGGMLILVEGIAPTRWLDLIFGLTEGWWRFADLDLRPKYPLLSASAWQELLTQNGFSQATPLSAEQTTDGVNAQQMVCVAQTAAPAAVNARTPGQWLIFADKHGLGRHIGDLLNAQGEQCTLVAIGDRYARITAHEFQVNPLNAEDCHRLLTDVIASHPSPLRGILHFWSLDCALTEASAATTLESSSATLCGSVLAIVQAAADAALPVPPGLWLFTRGAQAIGAAQSLSGAAQSPLWGLGKVIALEHPELKCVRLDLDPQQSALAAEAQAIFEEIREADAENQVAFRRQSRYVARLTRYHAPLALPNAPAFRLAIAERGTIANLQLQPGSRRQPGAGEIEIQVTAAGVNFRDVLNVLGLYPGDAGQPGSECAGKVSAVGSQVEGFRVGDPVIAIASGSFAQYLTLPTDLVFPQPPNLTAEEAATLPIAFLTAFYALQHCARITSGDTVLIHAAAGGVGQAAIQLAQQAGAKVFATASPAKWDALKSLGVQQIYNSRTLDFAAKILADTAGQGVDIVLNCLSGEWIPKSLSVVKPHGRFVEIGKVGVWSPTQIAQARPDVAYFPVDLAQTCQQQPELIRQIFAALLPQFADGRITPLPRRVFPIRHAQQAFRTMQQAKHVGKLVLAISDAHVATSAAAFRSDGTYLITGGFGGLGTTVADWLGKHGARHVVLLGRSEPSLSVRPAIQALTERGMKIVTMQADVAQEAQLAHALNEIERNLPPLRGIIHAAGMLDDGVLRQQNWARFARLFAPKVMGTWNLHRLTRHLPLEHFIMFSSIAALFGSPGQANHSAANAFLDAFAHYRRTQGLPGLSINWGILTDIGAGAQRQAHKQTRMQGMGNMSVQQAFTLMEQVIVENPVQVGIMPIEWSSLLKYAGSTPFLMDFSASAPVEITAATDFLQQIAQTAVDQQKQILIAHVQAEIANVLGLRPTEPIDLHKGFFEMGMDSLTSVELRNRLQTSFARIFPATLAFDYPTPAALIEYLAQEILGLQPSPATAIPAPQAASATTTNLDELSERELEALLARKLDQAKQYR